MHAVQNAIDLVCTGSVQQAHNTQRLPHRFAPRMGELLAGELVFVAEDPPLPTNNNNGHARLSAPAANSDGDAAQPRYTSLAAAASSLLLVVCFYYCSASVQRSMHLISE